MFRVKLFHLRFYELGKLECREQSELALLKEGVDLNLKFVVNRNKKDI